MCVHVLGLLWAGSGASEVWAAWLAGGCAGPTLPCWGLCRMSCSITAWLRGLQAWKGFCMLRFGTSFNSVASYLLACVLPALCCLLCAPRAQSGRLRAVLWAQSPCALPEMLRGWSTSFRAKLGALIPVLCLRCRWSPHPHLRPDAAKHRSAWTRKFLLPLAPSVSALSVPTTLNCRCWRKSGDLQGQSHVSRRHRTLGP